MLFIVFAAVNILAYNVMKIDANMGTVSLLIFDLVYLVITVLLLYLLNEMKNKILIKSCNKMRGNKYAEK